MLPVVVTPSNTVRGAAGNVRPASSGPLVLRPGSPVLTAKDTKYSMAVSPVLERYINYRQNLAGSTSPEDDSRALLMYARRNDKSQSELARRLYHELMLYQLEERRPHNERRLKIRQRARAAAERAQLEAQRAELEWRAEQLREREELLRAKRSSAE